MKKARVTEEHKTNYCISDGNDSFIATVRGSFFEDKSFPCVGDYVHYTPVGDGKAVIEELLPRTSVITRKSAHTDAIQIIVANVDMLFVVMGVDGDFNLSRLERYLLLAKQHEVPAVILLNKIDTVDWPNDYIQQAETIADTAAVHGVSAITGQGMEVVREYIGAGVTAVLLGSSGAGKSTITNWLLDDGIQETSGVRTDDSRGRHTTTSRELFTLPTGGYIIDTPGMRELGIVDGDDDAEDEVFTQIHELSLSCTYTDCDHEKSEGCAIQQAIQDGDITDRALQNYIKLQREREYMESRKDEESSRAYKLKKKKLHQSYDGILEKKRIERGL